MSESSPTPYVCYDEDLVAFNCYPAASLHPVRCCCFDDWPNPPTLEISTKTDFGIIARATGYAGVNLFGSGAIGNFPTAGFAADTFGTVSSNSGPPCNIFGCEGTCPSYNYEQINKFEGDAEEYEDRTDPCWDWSDISISYDYSGVVCNGPSTIQDVGLRECGNHDSRSAERIIRCRAEAESHIAYSNTEPVLCPPILYGTIEKDNPDLPLLGVNLCAGNIDDQFTPNVERIFTKAFIDDGQILRDDPIAYNDYFPVGSISFGGATPDIAFLRRSKRDHRQSRRTVKIRFRFLPPPSCYLKIWVKARITTYTTAGGGCDPNREISQIEQELSPLEWFGTESDCKPALGYPYSGNEIVVDYGDGDGEGGTLGSELGFFEDGEPAKPEEPDPEKPFGVTAGHQKRLALAFKFSWLPDYEPEWGCYSYYSDDLERETCGTHDLFSGELTGDCINSSNGLPDPVCHV